MLIESARRAESAVKEMLAIAHDGSATTDEFRDALGITESFVRIASALQTSAAAAVAGREQHGDGGAEVLATSTGLSRPEAHSRVKTAEALRDVPAARQAVESGRVSPANARRLAEAIDKAGADAVGDDDGCWPAPSRCDLSSSAARPGGGLSLARTTAGSPSIGAREHGAMSASGTQTTAWSTSTASSTP